jgi:hypothetical protein
MAMSRLSERMAVAGASQEDGELEWNVSGKALSLQV